MTSVALAVACESRSRAASCSLRPPRDRRDLAIGPMLVALACRLLVGAVYLHEPIDGLAWVGDAFVVAGAFALDRERSRS